MSGYGVILNGGTAENFTLGTVEGHQDPTGVTYDEWEPEDLVATVQFLATLDDRLPHSAYVIPGSSAEEAEGLVELSPFCNNNSTAVEEDDEADVNLVETMNTTSSSVEEANEPLLSSTTLLGDASAPSAPSAALSDITAEENSVSSAAQTPSSIEERSIIRTSNKPTHLKRYGVEELNLY